jgi:hypothetical protein
MSDGVSGWRLPRRIVVANSLRYGMVYKRKQLSTRKASAESPAGAHSGARECLRFAAPFTRGYTLFGQPVAQSSHDSYGSARGFVVGIDYKKCRFSWVFADIAQQEFGLARLLLLASALRRTRAQEGTNIGFEIACKGMNRHPIVIHRNIEVIAACQGTGARRIPEPGRCGSLLVSALETFEILTVATISSAQAEGFVRVVVTMDIDSKKDSARCADDTAGRFVFYSSNKSVPLPGDRET